MRHFVPRRSPSVRQFASFIGVGVVNTVAYNALFRLANIWMPYLAAHVIGFAGSMAGSFLLNCLVTYRTQPTWRRAFRFPLASLVNLVAVGAALHLGVTAFGLRENLAALLGGILATPLAFLLSRWALRPVARQTDQGRTDEGVTVSTR
jgi:polyisoprenyl-phosphate glycosyltransferase